MNREPSYCHHKGTGRAYVRLNGKVFYLGAYRSEESRDNVTFR
jgi:ribosomal protein L24E